MNISFKPVTGSNVDAASQRSLHMLRADIAACVAGAFVIAFAPPLAIAQDQKPANEIGKLFFSPQQRQELDRRRELNIQEATVAVESLYTVNGHVSRSSGKTTTWINGASQHETYKPRDPSNIALQPLEDEPPVVIKVGQTLDKTSGTIRDGIAGGEISVKKSATGSKPR